MQRILLLVLSLVSKNHLSVTNISRSMKIECLFIVLIEGEVMQGITMNEMCELISHYHDAEFEYSGTTYVLQPEVNDNKTYLVIWDCAPDAEKCIAKHEIESDGDIPQSVIDAVLSKKCFNGKSFIEIENLITVTVIY